MVFISSESTSTLDRGASSLCSSTLEKLKGFACLASESSVGPGATVKDSNTLDDTQIKGCDKKSLGKTEQRCEENKIRELEEEKEEEEGGSWVTGSEQVLNLDVTILKNRATFYSKVMCKNTLLH